MKKTNEQQALVRSKGFAVMELEDEMLQDVTGGRGNIICDVDTNCSGANCVAGCGG